MLSVLELRDFALIDELTLELGPGLNALTGETGAGKSIIVDALSQLAGSRADPGLIRSGSQTALIQGEFNTDTGPVVLARKLQSGSRSSARIDGELVTVSELSERARGLIGIHAQHASHELADPGRHIRLLDRLAFGTDTTLPDRYRQDFDRLRKMRDSLHSLKHSVREREQRLDAIDWQLQEIDGARLSAGEEEELRSRLGALRNVDAITNGVSAAVGQLSEADDSVIANLMAANRALQVPSRHSREVAALAAELQASLDAVQATASELESFLAGFESDPKALEHTESRLARIEFLQRKYGEDVQSILDHAAALRSEREQLTGADADIASLEAATAQLGLELASAAAELSSIRRQAATALSDGILPLLARLGMEQARFDTAFSTLDSPGPSGSDSVRFLFSANPGEPLDSLAMIASGGELSRLLLALNLVAGAEQPVLVFDEVDAGTGGRSAVSIGALLRQLSVGRQVLVVTHLPQVAAWADTQFSVQKAEHEGRTVTRVFRLDSSDRVDELARMLAGAVTDSSRRAARELLARSRGESDSHSASTD